MRVAEYLETVPSDRRSELSRVRRVIRKHLPKGYEEAVASGCIVWQVPLKTYPDTYNGHPLWLAALGARKNYLTLHFMPAYGSRDVEKRLRDGFRAVGKKLDMGKACIRFRSADDLALDTIGEIIAGMPVDTWVASARWARRR